MLSSVIENEIATIVEGCPMGKHATPPPPPPPLVQVSQHFQDGHRGGSGMQGVRVSQWFTGKIPADQ